MWPLLKQRFSPERLLTYELATNSMEEAQALYRWNTAASSALWTSMGHLEVLLRNTMHQHLTLWSESSYNEPRWYLNPAKALNERTIADITKARRNLNCRPQGETAGRVISELPFGFWRFLLAARYEDSLWVPCLRNAFPHLKGQGMRRDVHAPLAKLHELRNRIAHHEPIFNRPLEKLYGMLLTLAAWICPQTSRWIDEQSQVPAVLAQHPISAPHFSRWSPNAASFCATSSTKLS